MLILVLNLQTSSHPSNQNSSGKSPVQTLTYAQATSNTPIYNTIPSTSEDCVLDINKISSFLDDFRSLNRY